MRNGLARLVIPALIITLVACSTTPTGRRQLTLFPSAEVNQMGVTAYQQMQQQQPVIEKGDSVRYVQCVTDPILGQLSGEDADLEWEVSVFDDDAVNAFALPGGKIGVNTGLLSVAENQHQLATVIGHEIAHVLADHGNERMSQQFATGAGLELAAVLSGGASPQKDLLMGALGLGTQVGILLPFSRTHESEADRIGLELMAKAGFDPSESVELWRNMAAAGGEAPPEFLSTHPATDTRINDLQEQVPDVMDDYEQAREAGRRPQCG